MDFNRQRFVQYAKYDLSINRAFYRNLAIATGVIVMAITVLGFLIRWIIKINTDPTVLRLEGPDAYAGIGGTVTMVAFFLAIITLVFAGCFNHPLRNKQSRISVLTLPASNSEKFLWHTFLVTIGFTLITVASLLVADGVNFLLSLLAGFPVSHIYSITAAWTRSMLIDFSSPGFGWLQNEFSGTQSHIRPYLLGLSMVYSTWLFTTFVFVNAIKYRYNIVWTILGHTALQFVLSILMVVTAICAERWAHSNVYDSSDHNQNNQFVMTIYCIVMAILASTTVLMWWNSWRRYTKAQITTRTNR
mgnify:CR=1 FL=1